MRKCLGELARKPFISLLMAAGPPIYPSTCYANAITKAPVFFPTVLIRCWQQHITVFLAWRASRQQSGPAASWQEIWAHALKSSVRLNQGLSLAYGTPAPMVTI